MALAGGELGNTGSRAFSSYSLSFLVQKTPPRKKGWALLQFESDQSTSADAASAAPPARHVLGTPDVMQLKW